MLPASVSRPVVFNMHCTCLQTAIMIVLAGYLNSSTTLMAAGLKGDSAGRLAF